MPGITKKSPKKSFKHLNGQLGPLLVTSRFCTKSWSVVARRLVGDITFSDQRRSLGAPVVQLLQQPASNFGAAHSLPMHKISIFSKEGDQYWVCTKRAKNGPRWVKKDTKIVFYGSKNARNSNKAKSGVSQIHL